MTATTPRIYVACLAAYNNGKLHGRWIDCDQDVDDIRDEIDAMLAESPEPGAEEWAVHDHEGLPGIIGENPDLERLAAIGQALADCDEPEALAAYLDNDSTNDPENFAEAYIGQFDSLADFAEDLAEQCHSEDELGPFARYIDWEAVGRDAELGGDVWTARAHGGGVHVFWNR